MNAKIVVVEGGREQIVPMLSDEMWVGRGPECALRVDDALVSRKHAVLRRAGAAFVIEDRSSSNGTFVNDQRVSGEQQVRPDDVIRCGEVVVRFMVNAPEAAHGPDAEPAPDLASVEVQPEVEPQIVAIAEARGFNPESDAMRRRVEDLQTRLDDLEEQRIVERQEAEDLKLELLRSRGELEKANDALGAARESLAGRDRRVAQAEGEIAKLRAEADRLRLAAAEQARLKDAGWSQANAGAQEAEQLREVIRQQVTMLEERRVQLLVLEARSRFQA